MSLAERSGILSLLEQVNKILKKSRMLALLQQEGKTSILEDEITIYNGIQCFD